MQGGVQDEMQGQQEVDERPGQLLVACLLAGVQHRLLQQGCCPQAASPECTGVPCSSRPQPAASCVPAHGSSWSRGQQGWRSCCVERSEQAL